MMDGKIPLYIADRCVQMTITCTGDDGTVLHLKIDATKKHAKRLFQDVSFAVSEYLERTIG
jgi:hypothetical protein